MSMRGGSIEIFLCSQKNTTLDYRYINSNNGTMYYLLFGLKVGN